MEDCCSLFNDKEILNITMTFLVLFWRHFGSVMFFLLKLHFNGVTKLTTWYS